MADKCCEYPDSYVQDHDLQNEVIHGNWTRLMGTPGMPISPDDVCVESTYAAEYTPEQQQLLLNQLLLEADELFRKWDYSRPELLSSQGVRIGVCPVPDWPGGEEFAPSRRFFLFGGDRRVEFEDTYEDDPARRDASEDDKPAAAPPAEKETLYCITFYLLQPAPAPPKPKALALVSTFQALADGHMIPELSLLNDRDARTPAAASPGGARPAGGHAFWGACVCSFAWPRLRACARVQRTPTPPRRVVPNSARIQFN